METTGGLLQAATAVAMHAIDDSDFGIIDARLQQLANRVLDRITQRDPDTLIAHLHAVLFEEEGYAGESERYYNPLNSYLPVVLETRRGIPISLALVYKVVGDRVGLQVEGINAPGHFLVRVRDSRGWLIVDPFHGGRVLTQAEACALVARIFGRGAASSALLHGATHAQWVSRMLVNLQAIFADQRRNADLAAMQELALLLQQGTSN